MSSSSGSVAGRTDGRSTGVALTRATDSDWGFQGEFRLAWLLAWLATQTLNLNLKVTTPPTTLAAIALMYYTAVFISIQ